MNKYIDLHIHSTASDGTFTPAEILKRASGLEMRTIALTDHDTVLGIPEALEAAEKYGIELIPGIEMSVDYVGTYEILGYYIDYKNEEFLEKLEKRNVWRIERMLETINVLNSLGYDITKEEVQEIAGKGSIGRPHIANALIKKGYFNTMQEVFNTLLGAGKKAYVKAKNYSIEEVVQIILKAGGVPVLAHPYLMKMSDERLEEELKKLVSYGLKGIEAYYSESVPSKTKYHLELAEKYGLLVTCGSDFHGLNKKNEIGYIINGKEMIEDYTIVESLKRFPNGDGGNRQST